MHIYLEFSIRAAMVGTATTPDVIAVNFNLATKFPSRNTRVHMRIPKAITCWRCEGPASELDYPGPHAPLPCFAPFFDSDRVVNHGPTSGERYVEYEKNDERHEREALKLLVSPSNAPRLTCSTPSPPSSGSGSSTLSCLLSCFQCRLLCWMGKSTF